MSTSLEWRDLVLTIPSAAVLLYFILKISIAKTPLIIEYMEHLGIAFALYIDPLFITSSLVISAYVVLAAFNWVLETAGVVEKLNKNIEKPEEKDPEEEQMRSEHSLPLYHPTGMTGHGFTENKGLEASGRERVPSPARREESDRSMSWWAANMHKRFYDEAY